MMRSILSSVGLAMLIASCSSPAGEAGLDAALSGADVSLAGLDAGVDAGLPSTTGKIATIKLTRKCSDDAGYCSSEATASFLQYQAWPPHHSVITTVAGCEVFDFKYKYVPDGGFEESPVERSAGNISITGPRLDGGLALSYFGRDYMGLYPGKLWEDGETLTVTATGGDAPAFSGTIVGPADIVVTSPVCRSATMPGTAGQCEDISRSAPLTVAWTGATPAYVLLRLIVPQVGSSEVYCTLSSSPGTVDIPALLGYLDYGADAGGTYALFITPTNTTRFAAGDYTVNLSAIGVASNGDGTFVFSN